MNYKAWVAKAAKQPMALEPVVLGPLGVEDVEVAVEHWGLSHRTVRIRKRSRPHRAGRGFLK